MGKAASTPARAACLANSSISVRNRASALHPDRRGRPGQQLLQQAEQAFAPLRGRHRFREGARVHGQRVQQAQQPVQRIQRAAFQFRPRRDAVDVVVAAAGMAEQQAIDREAPGIGIVGRRAVAFAMRGIQPPARAGAVQPVAQAFEGIGIQPRRVGQRRTGQQVERVLQHEARTRQRQQEEEPVGQRLAGQRTGVGQRVRDGIALAVAAEHGVEVRHVGIDVGREHRDLARLQRRVEAIVLQQCAQAVVQHLQLAQPGVAGVELQAGIVAPQRRQAFAPILFRRLQRWRRAAGVQVALHPPQQAVGQRTGGGGRIDAGLDHAGRTHHVLAAQQRHEIATGRAPVAQQRVFAGIGGARLQVAPVVLRRRGNVEVQRARARPVDSTRSTSGETLRVPNANRRGGILTGSGLPAPSKPSR